MARDVLLLSRCPLPLSSDRRLYHLKQNMQLFCPATHDTALRIHVKVCACYAKVGGRTDSLVVTPSPGMGQ